MGRESGAVSSGRVPVRSTAAFKAANWLTGPSIYHVHSPHCMLFLTVDHHLFLKSQVTLPSSGKPVTLALPMREIVVEGREENALSSN